MAYNTVSIVRDALNNPIPQYYNPATDAYEPAHGSKGMIFAGSPEDGGVVLTTTPLGASESYTQQGIDRFSRSLIPNRVCGLVWADANGTLYVEESEDNVTWSTTLGCSVSASITTDTAYFKVSPWIRLTKRYFRFRYVNGSTAQTSFVLVQQYGGAVIRDVNVSNFLLLASNMGVIIGQSFSTSTPLLANETYSQNMVTDVPGEMCDLVRLGSSVPTIKYRHLTGRVITDQPGVLRILQGDTSSALDEFVSVDVAANTLVKFDEVLYCEYLGVRYENGATAQSVFKLSGYMW